MQLILTGIHQRTAPVALRERVAFSPDALPDGLAQLRAYADEGFIISTCNRVELAGLVDDGEPASPALRRFLADFHGLAPEELAPHMYTYTGPDAVRHLMRLAAGLDSMVLGEDQIIGQIKGALADAQQAGAVGPVLTRLLNSALAAGKLVRSQTGIARAHLSVVSVALDLARQTLGSLSGRRVLIVGAGRMAELALKHVHGEPLSSLLVTSRTAGRAAELAARFGAASAPIERLGQLLADSDMVICCTSAAGTVIDAGLLARARGDTAAPLLLLDLAVPRDIDRAAADLPGVQLFDVDDMREICEANRASRAAEVAGAEALVEGEVHKFMEWWGTQQVVPTIRALRQRAEAIRAAELERTLARLPELSQREQEAIQALSAAIINKLLHQPIAALKDPARGAQLAQTVQKLFQLESMREPHAVES